MELPSRSTSLTGRRCTGSGRDRLATRQARVLLMKDAIIIAGSLAQRPGIGGHTWVFLQYLLGLRRLGWDVLFLDRLDPDLCVDVAGRRAAPHESWNVRYFLDVMERFGLLDRCSLACGAETIGLSHQAV